MVISNNPVSANSVSAGASVSPIVNQGPVNKNGLRYRFDGIGWLPGEPRVGGTASGIFTVFKKDGTTVEVHNDQLDSVA